MERKTIALDREAYELLQMSKRKGESFSEAVKRIARGTRPLSDFSGAWRRHLSDRDIEEMEAVIARGHDADRERRRKLSGHRGRGR